MIKEESSTALEVVVTCDKCSQTGYVYEGRPYFLVAAWDHKCEMISRKVRVPKKILKDTTPIFSKPIHSYVHPEWSLPKVCEGGEFQPPKNTYWAMPMPEFFTCFFEKKIPKTLDPLGDGDDSLNSDDDGDLYDYRQIAMRDKKRRLSELNGSDAKRVSIEVENKDDDNYAYIPFSELIVFGNPRSPENEERFKNNPWELARLFHNVLRLSSLRMSPAEEKELQEIEERARLDEAAGRLVQVDYFSNRFALFMKPRISVPFARHDAVVERMTKEATKKTHSKRRVESLNEFRTLSSGTKEKVFIENEKILDEVQAFIRENVGIRLQEPTKPYGEIDVVGIYHNHCPKGKPSSFMVSFLFVELLIIVLTCVSFTRCKFVVLELRFA